MSSFTIQRVRPRVGRRPRVVQTVTRRVAKKEAKKAVRTMVQTKNFDGFLQANGTANAISATGFNILMTSDYSSGVGVSMVRGTGDNDFMGNRFTPVALKIRYIIDCSDGLGEDGSNTVSLMLIQARGAFTASSTSAVNQYALVNSVIAPVSPVNEDFNNRMRVLNRHIITVDQDDPAVHGMMTIKGKKLRKIFWDDSGAIESNPIFLSMVSDSTLGPHPTIRIFWRLYFKNG